jgi:hypothetical protein
MKGQMEVRVDLRREFIVHDVNCAYPYCLMGEHML